MDNIFGKNLSRDIAVIAEIGVNHEGDVDVAEKMVRSAKKSGASAVKFQSYTPERFTSKTDPVRFERVTKFALNEEEHRHLKRVADEVGICFFSTAVSEDWVPLIAELSPVIKIASGDLTFEPVVRAAAKTDRKVILSTGAGSEEEVDRAVGWIKDEIGEQELAQRLVLMHCVAAYPTPANAVNLRAIPKMKERYGVEVGWSNHVIGPEICLGALALGARVFEVHVTDKKSDREFRDHELSFEPQDLAELISQLEQVNQALGDGVKKPADCELEIRDNLRKGIISSRALSEGHLLVADDLMFARPAAGITSSEIEGVLGKRLNRAVGQHEALQRNDLA
ncbi:MAG: N-acetylneuraminate synthase family protein [Rhizobiaceae bacterium]